MEIVSTKHTDAWVMRVYENKTHKEYKIETFAWKWRGGKIYFWDKVAKILSGTAIITLEIDEKDEEIQLSPNSWDFLIPQWVPHIFYFPENCLMTERFKKGITVKDFERYRALKK